MTVILRASIRPIGDFDAEPQEIETTAADYNTARTQLEELTPDGYQMLSVRRED